MKILFLTPVLPYPPFGGDRIRAFNWIRFIGRGNEIYLVSFIDSEDEYAYLPELKKYCRDVVVVVRRPKVGLSCRLKNLFESAPYYLENNFKSEVMGQKIDGLLSNNSFDVVHVSTLAMSQYVIDKEKIVKILDGVDCVTRNYYQQFVSSSTIRNRMLSLIDWMKIRKYEPKMAAKFDRCLLINSIDRDCLLRVDNKLKIELVPNGVDLEYFQPQEVEEEWPSLVFTGVMSYYPNDDAMYYFFSSVFHLIETKFAGIKFYLIGKNISSRLGRILDRKKNVIVTGFVDDIRTIVARCNVFVCPLRMGTGIKNKVLEAMAMGKPVVTTTIGAESINVRPGKDLAIADTPDGFAAAVIQLLEDKSLSRAMGANARKIVERDHSWESLAMKIETLYREECN